MADMETIPQVPLPLPMPSPYAQGEPLFEFRISNSSVLLRLAVYVNKDKHYIESFGMF